MAESVQIALIIAVATLIGLYMFRNQLKSFRLKAGKEGVEWEAELFPAKAQKLAQDAEKMLPEMSEEAKTAQRLKSRLTRLAQDEPRTAIMEAWNKLEAASKEALKRHEIKYSTRNKDYRRNLQDVLYNEGILNKKEVAIFSDLRIGRNQSKYAPTSYDSKFTPSSAINYMEAALRLAEHMKKL
jgi:hypothetical protein